MSQLPRRRSDPRTDLLRTLDDACPSRQHPRVLVDRTGLDRLRREVQSAPIPWQPLHNLACRLTSQASPDDDDEAALPAGGVLTLALAHSLWGDRRFLEGATGAIRQSLAVPDWTAGPPGARTLDERAATWASELALAGDLLWDQLSGKLRAALLHQLEARAVGIFPGLRRQAAQPWARRRCQAQAIVHGHLGIATMSAFEVLPDWRDGLRPALEGVLDFLEGTADRAFPEGLAGWQDAIGELAWFALALRAFTDGAVDLFNHPALRAVHDFACHLQMPDGTLGVAGSPVRPAGWLMDLLAREFGNPILATLPRAAPAPADLVRTALCPHLCVPAAEASERGPSSRYLPHHNTVSLRDNWEPGAVRVALCAGVAGSADGPDAGALLVQQGRQVLFRSRGCSFLVDADGPGADAEPGRLTAVELGGPIRWALADLTGTYWPRLHRFRRYVLQVPPATVVLVDDVAATSPRHMRWRLAHSGQVSMQAAGFLVQQGPTVARIAFPLLDRRARYRLTEESWTTFRPTDGPEPQSEETRLVTVSPLHRTRHWIVVAVIHLLDQQTSSDAVEDVRLSPDGRLQFTARLPDGDGLSASAVEVDLLAQQVHVAPRG